MGLDVYLHRYDNFEETRRKEMDYENFSEKNCKLKDWEKMTEEEKDAIRAKDIAYAESLGLDRYGGDKTGNERCEFPSAKYPDHYFKVGYFRSSYNDGGINHILDNLGLPRLDDIFDVPDNEYYVHPDWNKAKANLQKLLEDFRSKPAYRVLRVSGNMFGLESGPKNEKEALDLFMKEVEKSKESPFEDGYSNINGEFFIKSPLKVLGILPGTERLLNTIPCVYVITESENEWYEQAIEIMIETCDYVLAQPNINQYYLHWSG